MDFQIEAVSGKLGMTFETTENGNVLNNMILSIVVARGSWWHNPEFGSRLHLLKKNTLNTEAMAVDYLKECLQWILDAGRVDSFEYETERAANRLEFRIRAYKSEQQIATFAHFVEVI